VPEGIVDALEIVEVDEEHPHVRAAAPRAGEDVLEPVEHQRAIRQPGERIVLREELDARFAFRAPA
jgi:hypothetical protein